MLDINYDLVVVGAGTSGVSCAICAAKLGLKTLLLEKKQTLGGTQVAGLCTPMMSNITTRNKNFAVNSIFCEILELLKKNNGVHSFKNNPFWFNPYILQKVYLELVAKYSVDVLYGINLKKANITSRNIISIETIEEKFLSLNFVDATGNASLSSLCGVKMQENSIYQPPSLRFMVDCVDTIALADFLKCLNDPNLEEYNGLIYSHYTWDGNNSKIMEKLVQKAVFEGIIEMNDFNYIQFFQVGEGLLAFNAPRLIIDDFNPNLKDDVDKAYNLGKEAILRIFNFFEKYTKGFEFAKILGISDELGIRESNRIKGRYTLTKEDVISGKKFENAIFSSDYPIDIHSNNKGQSKLEKIQNDYYQAPINCARPENLDNLYVIGRCISADRDALGSARIQPNCMEMGQKVAEFIYKETNL